MSRSYSTVIRRIADTNQGAGASAPAPQASREARPTQQRLAFPAAAILLLSATSAGFAAGMSLKDTGDTGAPYEWTGFYAGGHIGYAWGTSN